MAGPTISVNYDSDDGTTYPVLTPTWQNAVVNNVAGTAGPSLPKGTRKRSRMIMDPTTGREYRLMVGVISSAAWTAAFGAAVTPTPDIPGLGATPCVYGGRIGERQLVRGRKLR